MHKGGNRCNIGESQAQLPMINTPFSAYTIYFLQLNIRHAFPKASQSPTSVLQLPFTTFLVVGKSQPTKNTAITFHNQRYSENSQSNSIRHIISMAPHGTIDQGPTALSHVSFLHHLTIHKCQTSKTWPQHTVQHITQPCSSQTHILIKLVYCLLLSGHP